MKPLRRILLIGHYPLDRLDRAPKVRIFHMARALAREGCLTVISGSRRERTRWLRDRLREGLLDRVDLVYIESASSTATLTDLWVLWRLARRRTPVGIFVRDAYQRFPRLYPQTGWKRHVMKYLYDLTLWGYRRWATVLFFPTAGLARVVGGRMTALLPPGAFPAFPPPGWIRNTAQVIYVGAGGPHDGVSLLLEAMVGVRREMPGASLVLVMRPEEWPREPWPDWVHVVSASGDELSPYLWSATVAVIPRPHTAYNEIAFPVKLMDYLAHGLPVVVTEPGEAAEWVKTQQVGEAVSATPEALADGLVRVMARKNWEPRVRTVVMENTWEHRAAKVTALLSPMPAGTREAHLGR